MKSGDDLTQRVRDLDRREVRLRSREAELLATAGEFAIYARMFLAAWDGIVKGSASADEIVQEMARVQEVLRETAERLNAKERDLDEAAGELAEEVSQIRRWKGQLEERELRILEKDLLEAMLSGRSTNCRDS